MNILVDENIPTMTIVALRELGHEVREIRGTKDQGIHDEAVWRLCQKEKFLLVTTDKGFVSYRTEHHYGILIVRLRKPNRLKIHERVMLALSKYKARYWQGRIVVMRDNVESTSKAHKH